MGPTHRSATPHMSTAPIAEWLAVADAEIAYHDDRISLLIGRLLGAGLAVAFVVVVVPPEGAWQFLHAAIGTVFLLVALRIWNDLLAARLWVAIGEPVTVRSEQVTVSAPGRVMRLAAGRHLFVEFPDDPRAWVAMRPPRALRPGPLHTWVVDGTGPNRMLAAPDSTPLVVRPLG